MFLLLTYLTASSTDLYLDTSEIKWEMQAVFTSENPHPFIFLHLMILDTRLTLFFKIVSEQVISEMRRNITNSNQNVIILGKVAVAVNNARNEREKIKIKRRLLSSKYSTTTRDCVEN